MGGNSHTAGATARAGRGSFAALGAALSTLVTLASVHAATPADAVVTALQIEQGRHCVVTAARAPDGHPRVTARGDFCDGRRFLRAVFAALAAGDAKAARLDLDIDVKALAGFNNAVLRDASLRLAVRGGDIEDFSLAAKLGSADLSGDLRDGSGHRRVVHLEADDAGALLRLANLYRRVRGGRLAIAMSASMADGAARDGVASLSGFTIADEPGLKPLARMLVGGHRAAHQEFALFRLRAEFTARPGKVVVSGGTLTGGLVDATLAGSLDMAQDKLDVHGVMLPAAQFSWPATLILDLRKGELIGSNYTISGALSAPALHLDPLMTLPPGFLRELFALKSSDDSPPR